ncbi:hypothetical protein DICVIV_01124 [Dictyocaulus viviparus]|uniref:Uncharacterized protein n=1 Tax=Dictyocaulus viviparus TaxID=29172 RepID=A0A0D8Y722_DICVI|nr:hypothetical protein DICVIV_01124 [Dictyocaulus viviparus]
MSARMVDRIAALNDGKRTKVGMANCFEDRTALDCIDVCLKESENMQEDAVALAIATAVYSLRVDRTHNDAQETRYTFIRGKSDAEKAMLLATGENLENTKDKRRKKRAEKDVEAKKSQEIEGDECDLSNLYQSDWMKLSDSDNFDYTFGLTFPAKGSALRHWNFAQEFLERVESRRIDKRKTRRKRKLIPWKKIPVIDFCPIYTDFVQVTANLESDRVDALVVLRARRDVTGRIIILHNAMLRNPASRIRCIGKVELPIVEQCKAADDPGERFSYVEKNADKTLYTFKKPPKGTCLARIAPFIRVPVNKYANPKNRKIEDILFKEVIDVKPVDTDDCSLRNFIENAWQRLELQTLDDADLVRVNFDSSDKELSAAVPEFDRKLQPETKDSGKSLLSRLKDLHTKHLPDFEMLKSELKEMALGRCNNIVKELFNTSTRLTEAAVEEEVGEEDFKEWKTSRFLESVSSSKEYSFDDSLQSVFSKLFASYSPGDDSIQQRKHEVGAIIGTGQSAVEWCVPESRILDDISNVIKRGIHPDIRYMDATYHMKVFKFKVTVEQAHESLRQAERIGVGMTPEELAILKQKCFRPGRYNGIRDSGKVSVGFIMNSYRVDPWSSDETTTCFTKHYFSCCSYPKLEGALLQLRNDIQETAKKISPDSWYYRKENMETIDENRKNWRIRLKEAMSLFVSYMVKSEEKLYREKRTLPKLPQRSLITRRQPLSSVKNMESMLECRSSTDSSIQVNSLDPQQADTNRSSSDGHKVERSNINNDIDDDCDGNIIDDCSFVFPDNVCTNVEEEVCSIAEKIVDKANSTCFLDNVNESCRKSERRIKSDNVEEPPKKREKKKAEPDVKKEHFEQEYFAKSEVHKCIALKDRFLIADPRALTRSEDVIFARKKPFTSNLLEECKFENLVKPGLLCRGVYPGVKLEIKDSNDRFIGTLERCPKNVDVRSNMGTPNVELDVYDVWLTTFGGFRVFTDDDRTVLDIPRHIQLRSEDVINHSESEEVGGCMDNSFNDSVSYPNDTVSKKDRFYDIRPDEFKAIGINVKNLVPNKDFYSMTKEERAAAVAAEFEAIDALGPKKEDGYVISIMDFSCRVVPYHLNTAKMKRVMKSILSNPLLAYDKVLYTRRALLARRRAVERNKSQQRGPEVYFKKLDRSLDSSLGPLAEKILEKRNPMDITALDPVDVLEALTYRNFDDIDAEEEPRNTCDPTTTGVEESMRQFAAEVRQADFKVQGLHTFSSVMQCLPRRMGNTGKYVNVANALAVTLYMCNENTLTLVQERVNSKDKNVSVNEGEPWMGNFIITNAFDSCILNNEDDEINSL